jgi:hypothetical protein
VTSGKALAGGKESIVSLRLFRSSTNTNTTHSLYAWGDSPQQKALLVNGKAMMVTETAWHLIESAVSYTQRSWLSGLIKYASIPIKLQRNAAGT